MSWYAIDAIDESLAIARSFLFPVAYGRWLRLAVIVFFLGSVLSATVPTPPRRSDLPVSVHPGDFAVVLGVIAVLLLALFVVFGLIRAVMQFVLVDAVRSGSIRLRRYFRRWFGSGVRLFLFEIGVVLLATIPVLVIGLLVWTIGIKGASASTLALSGLILLPLLFVLGLGVAVLLGFTIEFVVPVMVLEECGVLEGWQRFWPTLKGEWKQYAGYVVIRFVLGLVVGFTVFLVVAILGAIVGFTIAVPGLVAFFPEIGFVVSLVFGLVGFLFLLVLALVLRIPVVVYFRHYSLLVLRKTHAAFDLLPHFDPDADPESDSAFT